VNTDQGLDFTLADYLRIHEALRFYSDTKNDSAVPAQSLEFLMKSFEKGSKPFRRILQFADIEKLKLNNVNTVKTFFSLIEIDPLVECFLKILLGDWNCGFYSNRCREFLYKFRNNTLGLNARVCKFVNTVDAECTFCCLAKEPRPVNSETFSHLFFNCPTSDRYRKAAEEKFFPEIFNAESDVRCCAAKAFYSCPAIISQRPESQKISKEPQENPEEESRII